MPVDICQPPAGKRSLTRVGTSSFDIFRGRTEPPYATPFASPRFCNDYRNPSLEAARDIDDSDQFIKPRRANQPVNPAYARGASHIKFGDCMTAQEADASLRRRPGSACRLRDMGGHRIFEGTYPYPVMETCGSNGSDISGCCPKRPVSSTKSQELSGHNVFAVPDASETPPPPPRVPYIPQERVVPPHDMRRNPRKNESHMQMGGPVYLESPRQRPSTCPTPSLTSSFNTLKENDVVSRARQVEEMKMRAFQGNHIFDFNDEPRNEAEDERRFSISKLAKRRDIQGNDIFNEGKRSHLRDPPPCGKRHVKPAPIVDPQLALVVNDPARHLKSAPLVVDTLPALVVNDRHQRTNSPL